ncbi:hypothetical protein [Marinomonas shanghaiensis]|uniref:hypothetical protein n=1 Tax=Marinomonas shanghaiensis TaxID=2202418 RepID=UPI000DBA6DD7|nr:hypothetical protein [Marinomonas shanghaiensis]
MTFKRENRYHALKASDVEAAFTSEERALLEKLLAKADRHREEQNKKPLTCLVIESDWPEYELAWKAIESRVNGKPEGQPTLNIQKELKQFKKTGNSTHARWIANELLKAQADSKFASIEKQLDVTVGHASGGDIKSGLLWAVLDLVEAKNRKLIDQLEKRSGEEDASELIRCLFFAPSSPVKPSKAWEIEEWYKKLKSSKARSAA